MDDQILQVPEVCLSETAQWEGAMNMTSIGENSWPEYAAPVEATFSIAHTGQVILLSFHIKEDHLRGMSGCGSKVSDDSCVEFFISFDGKFYYNFEFNFDGDYKMAYGKDRNSRILIKPSLCKKVKSATKMYLPAFESNRKYEWEKFLIIPKEVFSFNKINSFKGLQVTANFYKCGDHLPEPHYLSWKPVFTPIPDFHQINFFGHLQFL